MSHAYNNIIITILLRKRRIHIVQKTIQRSLPSSIHQSTHTGNTRYNIPKSNPKYVILKKQLHRLNLMTIKIAQKGAQTATLESILPAPDLPLILCFH